MRGGVQTVGHILGTRPLLAAVVEPIEHVQHRLGVLLLLLLANVGVLQHERPLLWHARELPGDGVEAHVYRVLEVCRVRDVRLGVIVGRLRDLDLVLERLLLAVGIVRFFRQWLHVDRSGTIDPIADSAAAAPAIAS